MPIMALSGCKEWEPDEKLIQNIWKEVMKITAIDPNTPMPEILFLKKIDPEAKGRFIAKNSKEKKIEVYLGSIFEDAWRNQDAYDKSYGTRGYNFSHKDVQALIYGVIAHEICHYALWLKRVPKNLHHRQMKEKNYLLPVLSYINGYFKINAGFKSDQNGYHVDIAMKCLERAIEIDEEEISKQKKTPTP